MKTGNSTPTPYHATLNSKPRHEKHTTVPFESGVVIAAEIAFAALLLYLTNHPVDFDDLTQTHASIVSEQGVLVGSGPLTESDTILESTTLLDTNPIFETGALDSHTGVSNSPATKVAVAGNRIETGAPLSN